MKGKGKLKMKYLNFGNKGLTLIEMLVVVTLLSLTMTAVTGIFRSVIRGQARALTSEELLNQTSYAIEYMGRALRMAKKDTAGTCIGVNLNYLKTHEDNGIKFLSYEDRCQEFYLATTTTSRKLKEVIDGGSAVDLTSDEIEVVNFNIGSDDSWDEDDNLQPRITIFLDMKGKRELLKEGEQPEIKIQITISQRNLDVLE